MVKVFLIIDAVSIDAAQTRVQQQVAAMAPPVQWAEAYHQSHQVIARAEAEDWQTISNVVTEISMLDIVVSVSINKIA